MSKYRRVRFFGDTDRKVDTVAMETTQLVLSHLKKLTYCIDNQIRYLCAKNN